MGMEQEPLSHIADQGVGSASAEKVNRNWAMACHLIALSGWITGIGFWLGPVVLWLLKRHDDPIIDQAGKEAVNFQITVLLSLCVIVPLCFVLIGLPLLALVGLFTTIMPIVAAIAVSDGKPYRYPFTLRLIK